MVSCYAFCKNFKRLLSQHLVKFSVSSQNLVMKSQNKSDTHVLRDETTPYLNRKGIIVAGVTLTSEWFWIKLAERPLHANKRMNITSDNMKFETFWTSLTLAMENVTKFSSDSHHKQQSTSLVTVYLHEALTIGGRQSTSLVHSRKKCCPYILPPDMFCDLVTYLLHIRFSEVPLFWKPGKKCLRCQFSTNELL